MHFTNGVPMEKAFTPLVPIVPFIPMDVDETTSTIHIPMDFTCIRKSLFVQNLCNALWYITAGCMVVTWNKTIIRLSINFKHSHLTKLVIRKVPNKKSVCCVCHKKSVLAHNAHFINL